MRTSPRAILQTLSVCALGALAGVAPLGCGILNPTYDADLGRMDNLVESGPIENEPAELVATPTSVDGADAASQGLDDVAVLVGPPPVRPDGVNPLAATDAPTDDAPIDTTPNAVAAAAERGTILVDALVGQINGRPVFASEFLEPLDARFRAEAKNMTPRTWIAMADEAIKNELQDRVRNELLLAEFEASLPPERRGGVLAFVNRLRKGLIRENRGSAELAEKRLAERGTSLDEEVRSQRDQAFINDLINREVRSRVFISWREIVAEYERNYDEYNPPGRATLRMIWVPSHDEDAQARVAQALTAGEAFGEIASRESGFRASAGGLYEVDLDNADYSKATIFGVPALNEQARTLEIGRIVGPFDYNKNKVWMTLENVAQDHRTLYEAQDDIYAALYARQQDQEMIEYMLDLFDRGVMTDMQRMHQALLRLAAERYLLAALEAGQ